MSLSDQRVWISRTYGNSSRVTASSSRLRAVVGLGGDGDHVGSDRLAIVEEVRRAGRGALGARLAAGLVEPRVAHLGGGPDEPAEQGAAPDRLFVLRLVHRRHALGRDPGNAHASKQGKQHAPAHPCLLCHRGAPVHDQDPRHAPVTIATRPSSEKSGAWYPPIQERTPPRVTWVTVT